MKPIRLIGKQIMALPLEAEKMAGLIHLPDKRNKKKDERPEKFNILAVGPRVSDPEIKAGVNVLASRYAGTQQKHDGKEYFFLSEDAIHAVL